MRIKFYTGSPQSQPTSLPMKVVRLLVGLVVVSIIVILAVFLFVYIAIFAAVFLGYLWWKTRTLRKNLRNVSQGNAPQGSDSQGGYVIEGEVIRETRTVPTVLLGEVNKGQTTTYEKSHGHNN